MAVNARVQTTVSCDDARYIPKVPNAGEVLTNAAGERTQVMHNGILVVADGYYDESTTEIIRGLQGHHEPQEEKVFYEVLQSIGPQGMMIELGAYWSYYSLWFQYAVPDATTYMIEPVEANLACGRKNFALNGRQGKFMHACVGRACDESSVPRTLTVDWLVETEKIPRIDILHSDIQGEFYQPDIPVERNRVAIEQLSHDVEAALAFPCLNHAVDTAFPDALFYDTGYHLTSRGAARFTDQRVDSIVRSRR